MKALQDQNTRYFELMVRQLEEIKSLLTPKEDIKLRSAVIECKAWFNDMIICMNNEEGEYNKKIPVGNFEGAMRELLYKLNGGEND